MNFKPNDKVVCIKQGVSHDMGQGKYRFAGANYTAIGFKPIKGVVYVVEAVLIDDLGDAGLRLVGSTVWHDGYTNPPTPSKETGWSYRSFRKLEEVQHENEIERQNKEALEEARKLINLY